MNNYDRTGPKHFAFVRAGRVGSDRGPTPTSCCVRRWSGDRGRRNVAVADRIWSADGGVQVAGRRPTCRFADTRFADAKETVRQRRQRWTFGGRLHTTFEQRGNQLVSRLLHDCRPTHVARSRSRAGGGHCARAQVKRRFPQVREIKYYRV